MLGQSLNVVDCRLLCAIAGEKAWYLRATGKGEPLVAGLRGPCSKGAGHQERPNFGGKPGEPVPTVDPEDLRIVWQIGKDIQAQHSGPKAVGGVFFEQACKPGGDIEAVFYRATQIWMMYHIASEQLAQFTRDGKPDDVVFRAAAKVPMEWMGVGIVREGPPFDMNEFLRLCEEEPKG